MTECPSRLGTRYKKSADRPAQWACDVCDHECTTDKEARQWHWVPELYAFVIPKHSRP